MVLQLPVGLPISSRKKITFFAFLDIEKREKIFTPRLINPLNLLSSNFGYSGIKSPVEAYLVGVKILGHMKIIFFLLSPFFQHWPSIHESSKRIITSFWQLISDIIFFRKYKKARILANTNSFSLKIIYVVRTNLWK